MSEKSSKINTSKGKTYLTILMFASLLVMAFSVNTNSMSANAIDLGLISKDTNIGSIDTSSLFNCVGAAITCDNDNTVNNNVAVNNGTNENPNPFSCVECFENANLTQEQIVDIFFFAGSASSFDDVCIDIVDYNEENYLNLLIGIGVSEQTAQALVNCLVEAGVLQG